MKSKISTRTICQVAMLIALTYVFERLIPIVNQPTFRITLAFIPMMCCGMLYGPLWCAMAYGIADILGWPLMGLTPVPLILLSRIVNGFIFGIILHRENLKFMPHAITVALTTQIICGAGLTTLGLSQLMGSPYLPMLYSRIFQYCTFIVLHLAMFPVLVRLRVALRKNGIVHV